MVAASPILSAVELLVMASVGNSAYRVYEISPVTLDSLPAASVILKQILFSPSTRVALVQTMLFPVTLSVMSVQVFSPSTDTHKVSMFSEEPFR